MQNQVLIKIFFKKVKQVRLLLLYMSTNKVLTASVKRTYHNHSRQISFF